MTSPYEDFLMSAWEEHESCVSGMGGPEMGYYEMCRDHISKRISCGFLVGASYDNTDKDARKLVREWRTDCQKAGLLPGGFSLFWIFMWPLIKQALLRIAVRYLLRRGLRSQKT